MFMMNEQKSIQKVTTKSYKKMSCETSKQNENW